MSEDRELLELAAKAAGVGPILCYESARNCLRIGDRDSYKLWRPLTDDGDALRLAIKLELAIDWDSQEHISHVEFDLATGETVTILEGDYDGCKATRRAIVRAAAEIGRAMP